MELYTMLFNGGLVLMGSAVIGVVVSMVVLTVSRKRLNVQLEKEYGLRQRRR